MMQSVHVYPIKGGLAILQECLMSENQRKFSKENFRKESALNAVKKTHKKTKQNTLKIPLNGSLTE